MWHRPSIINHRASTINHGPGQLGITYLLTLLGHALLSQGGSHDGDAGRRLQAEWCSGLNFCKSGLLTVEWATILRLAGSLAPSAGSFAVAHQAGLETSTT